MELNFETALMHQKQALPKIGNAKNNHEAERAARNFSSIFFSEYVGMMLEEVEKEEDEEFFFDVFRGLQAQTLGEKLVDSPAGQNLTQTVLSHIHKIQDRRGES